MRRDGEYRVVEAAYLVPGDRISLRTGGGIPADCKLQRGAQIQARRRLRHPPLTAVCPYTSYICCSRVLVEVVAF